MENKLCLNCSHEITNHFCANCGQKADTRRITFKKFIAHDLLHGVFHLERGILFTIKETVKRPGQAALDYISGKRIRYYNVFYLCLILIGLSALVMHSYDIGHVKANTKSSQEFFSFTSRNIKFVILTVVPMMAINARWLFNRLKMNLAEHFILGGMCLLGILFLSLICIVLKVISLSGFATGFWQILQSIFVFCALFFPLWTYFNATRKLYKIPGFIWRIVVFYLLLFLELLLLLCILVFFVTSESNLTIT